MLHYKDIIERLFALNMQKGMRLGLANATQLNNALNQPDHQYKSIHVAGTNGKGSVVTKIASALQHSGYKVGKYTSPHLHCFRERITINGEMISEETITTLSDQLFKITEQKCIPITFFDFTTCLALKYFADEKVDFAVIETGLGGRLDATNIITPILSIITSISLDHTEILGNTIEEITRDKGGIIKPHVPIVIGPRVPQNIIEELAQHHKSPFYSVKGHFETYDEENSAIAKMGLSVLPSQTCLSEPAIAKGLTVRPPCRLDILTSEDLPGWNGPFPKKAILDVGHNPDGLSQLFIALKRKFPQEHIRVVCGLSKSKDIISCLQIIKNFATHIHLVEAANGRGADASYLRDLLVNMGFPSYSLSYKPESVEDSIHFAIKESAKQGQILLICGTFFIMNSAYRTLGISVPSDPIDMNERHPPKEYIHANRRNSYQ